jgi:hypothetical protein
MDERLAGAIEATRAGDTKLAQLQLTRLLKEDPNHAQGWYLLSMLVDSGEKKTLFLKKVLAIDPEHAKAREQLSALEFEATVVTAVPTPTSAPVVEETPPVVDEADTGKQHYVTGVAELPSWLQEEEGDDFLEEPLTQVSIPMPESNLGAKPAPISPADESVTAEKVLLPPEPAAAAPPPPPKAKTSPKSPPPSLQTRTLNLAILVLIVLALLITFLLVRELLF